MMSISLGGIFWNTSNMRSWKSLIDSLKITYCYYCTVYSLFCVQFTWNYYTIRKSLQTYYLYYAYIGHARFFFISIFSIVGILVFLATSYRIIQQHIRRIRISGINTSAYIRFLFFKYKIFSCICSIPIGHPICLPKCFLFFLGQFVEVFSEVELLGSLLLLGNELRQ